MCLCHPSSFYVLHVHPDTLNCIVPDNTMCKAVVTDHKLYWLQSVFQI